ncbi:MAG: hypothetical protein IJJ69_07885 [Oscillospiraceae bacterium]|nr:hypothetical protein [Oscillospiraceae bacterium]
MDKISYLKGLMEGLGVHPESREGKLFGAVCEALQESAEYAKKLENRVSELEELCSILDEDLSVIEELVDNEESGCSACLSSENNIKHYYPEKNQVKTTASDTEETAEEPAFLPDFSEDGEDADGDFLDEEEYETICPTCGKVILLDERMLEEGETICPNCGEELEFDFDEEEIEKLAPSGEDETEE